tara:strand:+ start:164 stop:505 length:342 start_codon:yes stop_codon:yes gene_type:complete
MLTILNNIKNYNHNLIEDKITKLNKELSTLIKEKEDYETKKSKAILKQINDFISIHENNILGQLDKINTLNHSIEQTKIQINKFKLVEHQLHDLLSSNKVKQLNTYLVCLTTS